MPTKISRLSEGFDLVDCPEANGRCCSLSFLQKCPGEQMDDAGVSAVRFEDQCGNWTTIQDVFVG
jgi:hypothetical protein